MKIQHFSVAVGLQCTCAACDVGLQCTFFKRLNGLKVICFQAWKWVNFDPNKKRVINIYFRVQWHKNSTLSNTEIQQKASLIKNNILTKHVVHKCSFCGEIDFKLTNMWCKFFKNDTKCLPLISIFLNLR